MTHERILAMPPITTALVVYNNFSGDFGKSSKLADAAIYGLIEAGLSLDNIEVCTTQRLSGDPTIMAGKDAVLPEVGDGSTTGAAHICYIYNSHIRNDGDGPKPIVIPLHGGGTGLISKVTGLDKGLLEPSEENVRQTAWSLVQNRQNFQVFEVLPLGINPAAKSDQLGQYQSIRERDLSWWVFGHGASVHALQEIDFHRTRGVRRHLDRVLETAVAVPRIIDRARPSRVIMKGREYYFFLIDIINSDLPIHLIPFNPVENSSATALGIEDIPGRGKYETAVRALTDVAWMGITGGESIAGGISQYPLGRRGLIVLQLNETSNVHVDSEPSYRIDKPYCTVHVHPPDIKEGVLFARRRVRI